MVNLAAALEKITGIAHRLDGPYLVAAKPGGEPYIATWDEAILGVRPTDAAIAAAGLVAAQESACARIDATAEALRNTVLTPGVGQMAAYQAKEVQATALLHDAAPTEAAYPDIFNEVDITADTPHDVAMAVLTAAENWRIYSRAIETVRLSGKKAVKAATDVTGVAKAEAAVVWP